LVTAANYAAMKTLLAVAAADITNASANGRSLITAADYAAMRSLLGFTTTNITDMSANGRSLVTAADYPAMRTLLGLGTGATAAVASQVQAEAGTDNTTLMTPLRTAQAITALASGGGGGGGTTIPAGTLIRSVVDPGAGWTPADGTLASRTTFAGLFAAIGTRYGAADGVNNFVKPRILSRINNFRTGTSLPAGRAWHAMIALQDGRIMIVGGNSGTEAAPVFVNTVYFGSIAEDGTITWTTGTNYPIAAAGIMLTQLPDGRVLGVGGMLSTTTSTNATYFGVISGDTITWTAGTVVPANIGAGMIFVVPDGRIWIGGGFETANVNTTRFGTISGDTITWATGSNLPFTGINMSWAMSNPDRTLAQYLFVPSGGTARIIGFTTGSNTVTYTSAGSTTSLTAGNGLTALPCGTFLFFQHNGVQNYWIDPQTNSEIAVTAFAPASGSPYTVVAAARRSVVYVPQRNVIVMAGGLNTAAALSTVVMYRGIERAYLKT
jgi:hypothetical protein